MTVLTTWMGAAAAVGAFGLLIWAVLRHMALLQTALQQQLHDNFQFTQTQLAEVRAAMGTGLHRLNGTMGEQLGQYGKVMGDLQGQLGGLAVAAKQMQDVGKDISGLQDILRAPKLRGQLGELFLEEILHQVLPTDSYAMQYRLPGSERGSFVIVDAIIRLGDRIVPIDSKFPLESFQRLAQADASTRPRQRKQCIDVVCKHVDVIADKYIQPDAGTYDFALAYIPAENVYYEAVVRPAEAEGGVDLLTYAAKRKVVLVSANTFYAYLLTVAYGLKGLRIEKQAEAIRSQMAVFQKKFSGFCTDFDKIGRHIDLAQRTFDEGRKKANLLRDAAGRISGRTMGTEQDTHALGVLVDAPQVD